MYVHWRKNLVEAMLLHVQMVICIIIYTLKLKRLFDQKVVAMPCSASVYNQ